MKEDNTTKEIIPEERLARAIFGPDFHSLKEAFKEMYSQLTKREREVLRLRFGLRDGNLLSPKETGKRLRLSYQKVTAIERNARKQMITPRIKKSIQKLISESP